MHRIRQQQEDRPLFLPCCRKRLEKKARSKSFGVVEGSRIEGYQPEVSAENVIEDVLDLEAQLSGGSHDYCKCTVSPTQPWLLPLCCESALLRGEQSACKAIRNIARSHV